MNVVQEDHYLVVGALVIVIYFAVIVKKDVYLGNFIENNPLRSQLVVKKLRLI
jgi:hypothetical protein